MNKDLALVLELYRAAQTKKPADFAQAAFAWLKNEVDFGRCVFVTAWRGASWVDAHFCNEPDPRALMESHAKVRHLDRITLKMFESPYVAVRQDYDDPLIGVREMKPFRDHLKRFDANHSLTIAIPRPEDDALLTIILVRGFHESPNVPFTDDEVARFEALAPQIGEALAINRGLHLQASGLPVALVNGEGRFIQCSPAFIRAFWREDTPGSSYLPKEMFRAIQNGRPYPLEDGDLTVYSQRDEPTGGYRIRLRTSGAVDKLSPREREIATLFAGGTSYKAIAGKLALQPTTVRNHLQKIYAKLAVSDRDELIALLATPNE